MLNHKGLLNRLRPCDEATDWYDDQDSEAAWQDCQRGDWMLWIAAKLKVDQKRIVRAACACVRIMLYLVPERQARPRIAIETAERWCDGEATLAEMRSAARAAYAAHYDTSGATAEVSLAAACAADIGATADCAFIAASSTAEAAGYVASARMKTFAECAEIVREHIPWAVLKAAIDRQEEKCADSTD